jgi:hypothetical protein
MVSEASGVKREAGMMSGLPSALRGLRPEKK